MVQDTAVHLVQEIKVILHITGQTKVIFFTSRGVQHAGSISYFCLMKITGLLWLNTVRVQLEVIGNQCIICICVKMLIIKLTNKKK